MRLIYAIRRAIRGLIRRPLVRGVATYCLLYPSANIVQQEYREKGNLQG